MRKCELLEVLRQRYQQAAKPDKTRILDELVVVSGCHRKHALRLLTGNLPVLNDATTVCGQGNRREFRRS